MAADGAVPVGETTLSIIRRSSRAVLSLTTRVVVLLAAGVKWPDAS